MDDIRIVDRFKIVWRKNPISGYEWPEKILLKGFEVHGGFFCTTTHKTLELAEKEVALRRSMNKRFSPVMPRSKREIEKCKRLNLPIPYPYREMETGKMVNW